MIKPKRLRENWSLPGEANPEGADKWINLLSSNQSGS
jgi:hypothetical protein